MEPFTKTDCTQIQTAQTDGSVVFWSTSEEKTCTILKSISGNIPAASDDRMQPMLSDDTALELTWQGRLVCASAGFAELSLIFLFCGIHPGFVPLYISSFLWFLLSVLSSGALLGLYSLAERFPAARIAVLSRIRTITKSIQLERGHCSAG